MKSIVQNNKVQKLWDVLELTLRAAKEYENPYMDIDVWIDLNGPGFQKRVYGL